MPDWEPNWSDVAFDHAAATTAVTECRSSARAIDGALGGLDGLPATDHWVGRYKDDWSEDQGPTRTDLQGTAADLRALATAIEEAAAAARAEQAHREGERERWREELRAEWDDAGSAPTGPARPR